MQIRHYSIGYFFGFSCNRNLHRFIEAITSLCMTSAMRRTTDNLLQVRPATSSRSLDTDLLDATRGRDYKARMARFLFLKESKTYLNLDHVTAVKLQEQAEKRVAEVLLTGIDRPELISGTDVDIVILALSKSDT